MTIKVAIDIDRTFSVKADIDTVFEVLSDVPVSASYFPKVDALIELSENTYRWEMEKIAIGIHTLQTCYACKYNSDAIEKTVYWTPVSGEGNAIVSGHWKLRETADGTEIEFQTKANLKLPLPGLFSLAVSPLANFEFTQLAEKYLVNLQTFFNKVEGYA